MKLKRKILISLAVLLLLAIAFPFALRYKLQRDLANYKASLIAKGEKLTIAELIPPMPPASSNGMPDLIAAANLIVPLKIEWEPSCFRLVQSNKALIGWNYTNYAEWKGSNLWPVLSAWRQSNESGFEGLQTALKSPVFQDDVPYLKGLINSSFPNLPVIKRAIRLGQIDMLVNLHDHKTSEAFTNLLTQITFLERWKGEPLIISHLVRIAICHMITQSTWSFLQAQDITDDQLAILQAAWQRVEILQNMPDALAMERAMLIQAFTQFRDTPSTMAPSLGFSGQDILASTAESFMLWQWTLWASYPDELTCLKQMEHSMQKLRHFAKNRLLEPSILEPQPNNSSSVFYLVSRENGVGSDYVTFLLKTEARRRLAVCAVALQRYFVKHHKFPQSLENLVPEFCATVPMDMDGKPLRYLLNPDNQFLLYSANTELSHESTYSYDSSSGKDPTITKASNIVWPQLATENEIQTWEKKKNSK